MSSKGLSNRIKLSSYDDMFLAENDGNTTAEARPVEGQIVEIPLSELHTFENHPFRVVDDENMEEMVESVKEYGVLVPAIARPRAEGGYELISGHRRKHASELAGKDTMPVIVRDCDNDEAVVIMVDANIQREDILVSERAKAYQMKYEAMLDYEKSLGRTSMRKLLMKGGDLQVLEFATADMKKVEKYAKKYGILYSVLPDADRKNGKTEIIFHTEAVPRANMLLQKLSGGRIATFDDYLKNGDEKQLNKLMEFLKNQKKGNEMSPSPESARANMLMDGLIEKVGMYAMEKKTINVDAVKENFSINHEQAENVIKQLETIGFLDKGDESGNHKVMMDKEAFQNRIRGYQDLADRMRAVAASKHMNLSDVTISKTLIQTENERAVKTRIPGTWGEKARYVWIKKENIMEIHSGKTMLTFIDREKDYKIYDKDNRVVETMKGEALYSNHYDKVESSVRKRYEKSQVETETKVKTATKATTQRKR